ncbi:MAG: 5-deoxy-glucuronate isomerase [Bacillota bacterium]
MHDLYRRRPPKVSGRVDIVSPGAELNLVGLSLLRLGTGEGYTGHTGAEEVALVILSGKARIMAGGVELGVLGGRGSVFEGSAHAVYLPCQTGYAVTGEGPVEIALCRAPSTRPGKVQVITPDQVVVHQRGRDLFQRRVEDIVADNVEADHLVVGETFNARGNWSSYPPHKHDVENPPVESEMEEVYLFKIEPEQGFAVQVLYTKDGSMDTAYRILDGDVTILPRGYHPVAAAPGYQVYYLWAIAGRTHRSMRPNDDPDHAWVKEA